jgi:hypothetical protein
MWIGFNWYRIELSGVFRERGGESSGFIGAS